MNAKSFLLFIYLGVILCSTANAQENFTVKGIVADTANHLKLNGATISILDSRDSILQKFTYSENGLFKAGGLGQGNFLLMITYPEYADFVGYFTLDAEHPLKDFGQISMILQSRLLDEVIIKSRVAAIKINGDTTEFNAASYATQKNARVEDLLKQLQGMKINQSGAIIFQGEEVSRILVDGEEFFSDDPSLVTKNLRADMVNKVQVYDDKTTNAKLTGVDDGKKVKTINIVLMEDKKKGLFGKADAGYGTDDYYTAQLMFNKFKPKEKLAVYGNLGNTGKVGLSGADNSKFVSGYGNDNYGGNGIPFARDGGIHYDNKWNKDKQSINTNYRIGTLHTEGNTNTTTQYNLPGNYNKRTGNRNFINQNFNQLMDANFNSVLDSLSDLSVYLSASRYKNQTDNSDLTQTMRGNGILQNTNMNSSEGERTNQFITASTYYVRRFKKKGRSLSITARSNSRTYDGYNYQRSDLAYYDANGVQDSVHNIDQYKPGASDTRGLSAGFSYSDVFSKSLSVTAGYSVSYDKTKNNEHSFNQSSAGVYNLLDSTFSNDFKLNTRSGTYSLNMNYSSGKTNATLSSNVSDVRQNQDEVFSKTTLNRKYLNWSPGASFRYQLNKATSLSLRYAGYTMQPSISELQPLRQNSDPLNISLGNPELKPEFENRIDYNYRVYQPTQDRGINFRGYYATTANKIVQKRSTDSAGVNTFQYNNLKDNHPNNWNVYAEVYGHATKLDFILSINFTAYGSTYFNYVNDALNKTTSINYRPEIDIWKNKPTYSYYLNIGPNFTVNSSSLQKQVNNNINGFFTNGGFYAKLPGNFFAGADFNYKINGKNEVFDRPFEQLLLKSYAGKTFLKNEELKLQITGNDLLNQNTGYSRYSGVDSFTESRNITIKRYFMFSLTWDFSKFGKSPQKQGL